MLMVAKGAKRTPVGIAYLKRVRLTDRLSVVEAVTPGSDELSLTCKSQKTKWETPMVSGTSATSYMEIKSVTV